MPWRDSSTMDLKTQFIADYLRPTLSISELCQQYNISRKTGYKWIDRYLGKGASALEDGSHRPHFFAPDSNQTRRGISKHVVIIPPGVPEVTQDPFRTAPNSIGPREQPSAIFWRVTA